MTPQGRRDGTRAAKEGVYNAGTRRAKWVESPEEHAERKGQTLATRNHDVIKRWAEERRASPATVASSRARNGPRTLRFDFPGYGGRDLVHIGWDDWLQTFDERGLVFLYQEQMRDGRQSNFFRLDNPTREDA